MPSQFSGLMIGYSGLTAYQAAENTTANNIANVKTTGYSRQMVNQTAESALRTYTSYGMAGMGVAVNSIDQLRDQYLDIKYWANQADVGRYSVHQLYTSQIENYFKESSTLHGFESVYSEDFYSALSELEKNPYSDTARTAFIGASQSLTEYFNTMSDNLQTLQKSLNLEIKTQVERINAIAEQISNLNNQINTIEINGHTANELRDKRNNLIDELATIVDVTVEEQDIINKSDPDHNLGIKYYKVTICNGNTLVDGYEYNALECISRDHNSNQTDVDGLYDIYWQKTGNRFLPMANNLSGSLKALIELRDGNNLEALAGKAKEATGTVISPDSVTIDGNKVKIKLPYGIEEEFLNNYVLPGTDNDVTEIVSGTVLKRSILVNGDLYECTFDYKNGGAVTYDAEYMEYTFVLDKTPVDKGTGKNIVSFPTTDDLKIAGKAGDESFTMIKTSNAETDLQAELSELDIPVEGIVTISGSQYYYTGFEVELITDSSGSPVVDASGKWQYKYTFNNLEYLDSSGRKVKGLRSDVSVGSPVYVGQNVDYQGIPYYQSQMSLWVRQFAAVFNETELYGGDMDASTYGYDANGDRMHESYFNYRGADGATNDFSEIDPANQYATTYKVGYKVNPDGSKGELFQKAGGGSVGAETDFTSYYNLTAGNFVMGEDIVQDSSLIATTTSENSNKDQSDNDLVLKLEEIKTDKNVMKFRGASSSEFLNKVLGDMALNSNNARTFSNNSTNIANVISNQRLSVSGVDEDEEALDLVKFQNAYNLNSKVIQIMTEIYDRLILETGV